MGTPRSSTRRLAQAVAEGFSRAALTPREMKSGMTHGDLPWSCPPLLTEQYLGRVPLQEYYDGIVNVAEANIFAFWHNTLNALSHTPSTLIDGVTLTTTKMLLPTERLGTRAFLFSAPAGYPGAVEEISGLLLSMELAQACYCGVPISRRVIDDDNFYVELRNGSRVGVVNGLPAIESDWTFDGRGLIGELAHMPRGEAHQHCWYDSLAYARSLLHQYRSRFLDFEAMDSAIQALRFMTFGGAVPELLVALQVGPHQQLQMKERITRLEQALSIIDHNVSDRDKVSMMRQTLVPDAMSVTEFRLKVFAHDFIPFTLEAGKMERIRAHLQSKLEQLQSEL